jgi:hypothetical protein
VIDQAKVQVLPLGRGVAPDGPQNAFGRACAVSLLQRLGRDRVVPVAEVPDIQAKLLREVVGALSANSVEVFEGSSIDQGMEVLFQRRPGRVSDGDGARTGNTAHDYAGYGAQATVPDSLENLLANCILFFDLDTAPSHTLPRIRRAA